MKVSLRQEQEKFYHDERKTLLTQPQVKKSSSLLRFYPLFSEGILCVGGRLANADLPDEAKYPRIVPEKSELSRLIIGDAHSVTLHGGVNQTMAHIRTKIWIPSCRNRVRKLILNCVGCSRFHATPTLPLMGDLPNERCNIPTRAFTDVGIDFAGPFSCKAQKTSKIYMAIFACFASKAVHIEAVSDLTTAGCVAAFRRFVARRGCPSVIYSDNGTDFNGASSDLEILQEVLKAEHQDSLQAKAAGLNIKWKFIPARAPHFGGLWEAAVKCAKRHLRIVMGNHKLTFEEFTTILCQIEQILNSRPISFISDDVKDDIILTPAHLCLGSQLESYPMKETKDLNDLPKISLPKRWAFIQNIITHFWKRWNKEYVSTLQERNKWKLEVEPLKIVVYITDDNVPPLQWPLGKVTHVFSGPDKFVRVVKVKTAPGTYSRPVHKLRKLPL